ncbi:hypothetical protein AB1Y20_002248 [Prymnesium parvum]|uniref:Fe2OG dioxygenase domain-containing protein n=1 Tax=Prymnesium parvum TaxID=97485 RepID=A0AB34JA49_PRYPA
MLELSEALLPKLPALTLDSAPAPSAPSESWIDPAAFLNASALPPLASRRSAFARLRLALLDAAASFPSRAVGLDLTHRCCAGAHTRAALRALARYSAADDLSRAIFRLDCDEPPHGCGGGAEERRRPRDERAGGGMRDAPGRPGCAAAAAGCRGGAEERRRLLDERGWVGVRDWGLHLPALQRQAQAQLDAARGARRSAPAVVRVTNPPIPALEPLLRNQELARLLSKYLGGPVRYEGHVLLHVSNRATPANYISAQWHHDRCGRRVKVFVFLHDVGIDGHPTLVAERTNKLWYYMHEDVRTSRIDARYVYSNFNVTPMVGPAGGGFVFDTNMLHRGMHEGSQSRTTLVLEFHRHGKIGVLSKLGVRSLPCPSLTYPTRSTVPVTGRVGYQLFPPENDTSWTGRK